MDGERHQSAAAEQDKSTMMHANKIFVAEVLVVLLGCWTLIQAHPPVHRPAIRPATSYSYFSMALPAHHGHHAAAASTETYVAHDVHALQHPGDDGHLAEEEEEVDEYHHQEPVIIAHPKYEYKYGVEDSHTGDFKHAKEERDGDVVKGEYSLLQPDGRKRIVHYTASKHGGFNAIVSYSGHAIHPEVHQSSHGSNEEY